MPKAILRLNIESGRLERLHCASVCFRVSVDPLHHITNSTAQVSVSRVLSLPRWLWEILTHRSLAVPSVLICVHSL